MVRYSLKSHITLFLLGMLFVASLLTTFVILSFWAREAAYSFSREKELALALLAEHQFYRFLSVGHEKGYSEGILQRALENQGAMTGCSRDVGVDKADLCLGGDVEAAKMSLGNMIQSIVPGEVVRRFSGSQWVGIVPGKKYLDIAMQVVGPDRVGHAVALRFALEPQYRKIWSLQRYIAIYLLVNLIILVVIAFYRIRLTVLRPVERLLQLTQSYQDEQGVPFLVLEESNELTQLYISMQQMLGRIRADREKLQQHLVSLEQANQLLQKNQEEMVRAEKLSSVGRLAAGLAHEIGNPVGIVQGYLGLIGHSDVQLGERREFCTRAEQELQRISLLIRQLLDFARPATGEKQLVDPAAIIDDALSLLIPQPLFDGIEIIRHPSEGVCSVWCDPSQLLQVLLNCLMNAADAIHAAGPQRKVVSLHCECERKGETSVVVLRLADNGVGLSSDELSAAFDPFFTTKAPGRGTGLGLSVSYALLQSMGGSISLTNRPEGGALVTIEIPKQDLALTSD